MSDEVDKGNTVIWDKVAKPPKSALKQIMGGRLSGMTDISPQWRYRVLTELFGPVGFGWTYEIKKVWIEDGPEGDKMVFVDVDLFIFRNGERSMAIPGSGGSQLIAKESRGLRANDEAVKMATTDALSVACKMLGIGAAIYAGEYDGSKYNDPPSQPIVEHGKAPTLNEVLKAIDAANDMISLNKTAGIAAHLKSDNDKQQARAAFSNRRDELSKKKEPEAADGEIVEVEE